MRKMRTNQVFIKYCGRFDGDGDFTVSLGLENKELVDLSYTLRRPFLIRGRL